MEGNIARFCGRCHRPILEPQWEVEFDDEKEEDWDAARSHFIHAEDSEGCEAAIEQDGDRFFQIIKAFLHYSFAEIDEYGDLTFTEREICTEEEWLELKKWVFEGENDG